MQDRIELMCPEDLVESTRNGDILDDGKLELIGIDGRLVLISQEGGLGLRANGPNDSVSPFEELPEDGGSDETVGASEKNSGHFFL